MNFEPRTSFPLRFYNALHQRSPLTQVYGSLHLVATLFPLIFQDYVCRDRPHILLWFLVQPRTQS
jgi:hypothetical protein